MPVERAIQYEDPGQAASIIEYLQALSKHPYFDLILTEQEEDSKITLPRVTFAKDLPEHDPETNIIDLSVIPVIPEKDGAFGAFLTIWPNQDEHPTPTIKINEDSLEFIMPE